MKETTSFSDFEKGKKGEAAKKRKGPVRSMRIHPVAKGGFVSEAEHEDMSDGNNHAMMYGSPTTKKHHKTAEEAGKHVTEMFGGKQAVASTPENKAEAKADGAGDEDKES